jgi:hypothetical protein
MSFAYCRGCSPGTSPAAQVVGCVQCSAVQCRAARVSRRGAVEPQPKRLLRPVGCRCSLCPRAADGRMAPAVQVAPWWAVGAYLGPWNGAADRPQLGVACSVALGWQHRDRRRRLSHPVAATRTQIVRAQELQAQSLPHSLTRSRVHTRVSNAHGAVPRCGLGSEYRSRPMLPRRPDRLARHAVQRPQCSQRRRAH